MEENSSFTSNLNYKVIAIQHILDTFGNAKTNINNNSSRFGQCIKLLYIDQKLVGVHIETCLLEKSRITFQDNNQRNYHIAYLLYHGMDKAKHEQFHIQHPSQWHYTNQGNVDLLSSIDNPQRFEQLQVEY